MLDDKEFRTRMKLLANDKSIFEKWDAVIDELIVSTYPSLNKRQIIVVRYIIQVIWDIGFSTASYAEVVFRLLLDEKPLFRTRNSITKTILELCERGILKSEMTVFESRKYSDGKLLGRHRTKILIIPDKLRIEALTAMSEAVNFTMSGYFLPEEK